MQVFSHLVEALSLCLRALLSLVRVDVFYVQGHISLRGGQKLIFIIFLYGT